MRLGTYYRAELLRALGIDKPAGRVLDVGGYDGYWLAGIDAGEPCSIDIDPVPSFGRVKYLRGSGDHLPFHNDVFDTIFALDVIEHVEHDEPFVEELLRVLKSGGTLYLTTPHQDIRIFPAPLTTWANRRWQHHRTTGYTPETIQRLVDRRSPRNIEIRQMKTWWFRNLYLPLSALWRISAQPAQALTRLIAKLDGHQAEAQGGYLLATIVK